MNHRIGILTLIAEVRGRLDELERLVQFGAEYTIPTPQAFEEVDVEDITPLGYVDFRQTGMQGTRPLDRFTPIDGFVQFAAPNHDTQCEASSFALSDLHRNETTPGFGLTMIGLGDQQDWFAFEFLNPDLDPKAWQWTEWILKISVQSPGTLFSQFILHGEGDPVFVEIGAHEVSEYATFFHFRLERDTIPSDRLGAMTQVRLVLSTGGHMMGLNVYSYGVFGHR